MSILYYSIILFYYYIIISIYRYSIGLGLLLQFTYVCLTVLEFTALGLCFRSQTKT